MPLAQARPFYKPLTGAAQTRNHKFAIYPAPVLGLDTSTPLTEQDPRAAQVLTNFLVRRYGSELRGGYLRHTTNLGGVGTESPVASLMAYQPPRGAGSVQLAKMFAACEDGNIYDVTDPTNEVTVPAVDQAVPGQLEPGEFSWVNFATANTNYLCTVSSGGGYWTYDDAGGWIDRTATTTGGPAIDFDFVMVWKNRLWFIADASTRAYYLPVGAITGALTVFDFGPLLTHGGELRAMASWTVDSGDGIDDKLVIVSASGDVLVYGGTDPTAAATFGLIGRWYIGPPPHGRRFMGKYGGDLGILCENGVEYMSRLMQAHGLLDPETQIDNTISRRYNEVIGRDIRDTRGMKGWTQVFVPGQEAVVLVTPHNEPVTASQYCFSTIPAAWSDFIGMPMACAELFDGNLYFGTLDGKVGKAFVADSDDELSDGTVGVDVVGYLQSAYVAPNDERMELKRPQLVMPMFQSSEPPSVSVQINTEWSDAGTAGSPPYAPNNNALWDVAVWDVAVWAGGVNTYQLWVGAEGLGCYMALRLALLAKRGTVFTSWKIIYEPGGVM